MLIILTIVDLLRKDWQLKHLKECTNKRYYYGTSNKHE